MITLTVDGVEVEVEEGSTVLQACETAGKEVPRFCYHDRLSIAGNCRMCLVEMERSPKPVASCAMPAGPGMVIKTDTEVVKKAREGVMEFMLINHPLDCPICDQGGECDLQDQAMGYGGDRSRYQEPKRAVENKSMGPLISTIMTRCIHCTRCVRFSTEVAGVNDMGAIGRGESMEITTYLEKALASELSGNVVDLCPVGALTSRPYAFNARSWELSHTESFDAMDAVGSAIRIDTRGNEVMRVLPRVNDDVNEEWISDKTRHAIDGLKRQRIDRPYLRQKNGRLAECSWEDAFKAIQTNMKKAKASQIGAIMGDQCDAESIYALKSLMDKLGVSNVDCRQDGSVLGTSGGRGGYIFNSGFNGLEDTDYVLLIGTNPRHEAAVVNARLRRRWLNDGLDVARIGAPVDLTYPVKELGDDPSILMELADGKGPVATKLKRAKKPMIIIGQGALTRKDSAAILGAVARLSKETGVVTADWNGFNVLHTAAARVAGLDLGAIPGKGGMDTGGMLAAANKGDLQVLYLLAADECDLSAISKKTFVIYQGHHGDAGARAADVVLPGAAWCEKDGIFVNSEGRVQYANRATFPPGDARSDWSIIRALSAVLDKTLDFDTHAQLRAKMIAEVPVFAEADVLTEAKLGAIGGKGKIASTALTTPIGEGTGVSFYMTCPISRSSVTMAECIDAFEQNGMKGAAE
ncbi:MAG: NADH-quinone oxidoreductase subunit G [Alphaproteobacteria bacterium]|nr:NADH-quinone oxidoreductase subunit G [Alphaproteobacteria bacterium]